MWRRILVSTLIVVPLGTALHFVYQWTGRNAIAGIFSPLNESTWEHLKLAFWPMLLLAPLHRRMYGDPPGWLPATAIRTISAPLLIIVLFHGYTAILGTHQLPLDIVVFMVSVFGGETLGHLVMERRFARGIRAAAAAAIMLMAGALVAFSLRRPPGVLFVPPPTTRVQSPEPMSRATSRRPSPAVGRQSRAGLTVSRRWTLDPGGQLTRVFQSAFIVASATSWSGNRIAASSAIAFRVEDAPRRMR